MQNFIYRYKTLLLCCVLFHTIIFIPPLSFSDDTTETLPEKKILFLGDSLTAGYGINANASYPAVVQEKLKNSDLPFLVINAGVSGDTSAGGLRRMNWLFKQHIQILVLALGANDGLRGLSPQETKKNLEKIVTKARAFNPEIKILLLGMLAPPNMGNEYTENYKNVFQDISTEMNIDSFLPFLLEGVASEPSLNLADGIHPNKKGHSLIATNVWEKLKPLLEEE